MGYRISSLHLKCVIILIWQADTEEHVRVINLNKENEKQKHKKKSKKQTVKKEWKNTKKEAQKEHNAWGFAATFQNYKN